MEKPFLIISTIQETVEGFLTPHIKLLESMGYRVWIATNVHKKPSEELKENIWINIDFNRNPFSKQSFLAIKQLKKLLTENKFEGIHCHTPVAAFLGRFVSNITGQKNIIYTAHGFHFYKGAPLKNWLVYYPLERIAARWTDKIITMNEEDYNRGNTFASKKTKVYKIDGVGVDLEKYSSGNGEKIRKEFDLKNEDFIITIIGELNENKNQIQIIKAVEILKKESIETRLFIVGFGKTAQELQEYVKKNNLEKNVYFLGFRRDIKDIIAASDILTSMSYREGLPRNIMEGMSQGKPFIVTDIRGSRDIIKDGINGYLVNVNDTEKTAEKIKLLMNKNLQDSIKINNLRDIKKFSQENILAEMAKIYGENL